MPRTSRLPTRALVGLLVALVALAASVSPVRAGSVRGPKLPKGPNWAAVERRLDVLVEEAAANGVTLSITVKDLSGSYHGAVARAGGNETVKAASIIKLPLLALLMDKVDHGDLSLDTLVTIPAGDSNIVGGSGTLRNRAFPLDISVRS